MKNVLQVLNYTANYRGNFMDSLKELDEQLHRKGNYCVYFFLISKVSGEKIDWIAEMIDENIPVYFMEDSRGRAIKKIRKIIFEHQIEIIHTHFLTANQFLMIKLSNLGMKKDVVIHFHNHAIPSNNFVKRFTRKKLYKGYKMIGVSASVTEGLRQIYPYNKCYEVDNAIDFERLNNYSELDLDQNNENKDEKICLIFGFDYERKGVDLALEAVSQMIERGEKIKLLISLSTNETIVKKKIEERFGEIPCWVIFIKARNDVATLYRKADIFLSPSREEGFCYSIVEAAYCGCNVVASWIPAQKDLKVPGVFWCETENSESLHDAIIKAFDSEKKLNVTEVLRQEYKLEKWGRQVIEIYEVI